MAKYLAQIVMLGAQVVGRAFTRALRQEFAASQTAAQNRRSNQSSNGTTNDRTINAKLGMSFQEALQILNLENQKLNNESKDLILKNYNHLFDVNDKSKGGSFYLQSKVVRAKERIEEEMKININDTTAKDDSSERKRSENP